MTAGWDPARDRWRALPEAPVPLRAPVGVWAAGRAVVVTPDATLHLAPRADRWETGPLPPRGLLRTVLPTGAAAAAGGTVLVAGTGAPAVAAYDVTGRRWRTLAVPAPRDFVHTPALGLRGGAVVLLDDSAAGGAGWTWARPDGAPRRVPALPTGPGDDTAPLVWFRAVAAGDAVHVVGRTVGATAMRAATLVTQQAGPPAWRPLPPLPLAPHRQPVIAAVGGGLLMWSGELGEGALYRPGAGGWEHVGPAPLARGAATGTATPGGVVVWTDTGVARWTAPPVRATARP